MSSKRRRREKRKILQTESLEEFIVKVNGGIFYERMPGRGLAFRREYRPMAEIATEQLTVEMDRSFRAMVGGWYAGGWAIIAAMERVTKALPQ